MTFRLGRVVVYPGFVALLSASAYFGSAHLLMTYLIAALVHESGHVAAAWLLGCRIGRLTLSALGAELELEGGATVSFGQDLLLSLAGPAANLLMAALLAPIGRCPLLAGASLLLGCFNLLPVRPLDGGNALFALLSLLTDQARAERLTGLLSGGFALSVLAGGAGLLALPGGQPWLLLAGAWLCAVSFAPWGE